ncbi:MAG: hypothetical protein NVV74_10175 [Magnetospirillum sp.]|nr:hypothetical protein [Magnetospirillum sp.]
MARSVRWPSGRFHFFIETVEARSGVTLARRNVATIPEMRTQGKTPLIVGRSTTLRSVLDKLPRAQQAGDFSPKAEGFWVGAFGSDNARALVVAGDDDAGVLYGLGFLLRQLSLGPERVGLFAERAEIFERSAPRWPVRGVTFSYGELSNTYGTWTRAQFKRQLEELAWFGLNHVQIAASSKPSSSNPEDFERVIAQLAEEAQRLGMKVTMFAPMPDADYSKPEGTAVITARWDRLMSAASRVDGMLVPGGDPGHTPAQWIIPAVSTQARLLAKRHPGAEIWITFQGFSRQECERELERIRTEQPAWLTGVAMAPWTDMTVQELREKLPARYAVRSYIDLTHVLHSEHPVEGLDQAAAILHGREPICPRPGGIAEIVRRDAPSTIGGVLYSEGVHDDINKVLWTQLLWDPEKQPE